MSPIAECPRLLPPIASPIADSPIADPIAEPNKGVIMRSLALAACATILIGFNVLVTRGHSRAQPAEPKPSRYAGREIGPWAPGMMYVTDAAFSPDGQLILAAFSNGPELLILWDAATGKEIRALAKPSDNVKCAGFFPDGKRTYAGVADGSFLIHDVATGRLVKTIRMYGKGLSGAVLFPDGNSALTYGWASDGTYPLQTWDLRQGKMV